MFTVKYFATYHLTENMFALKYRPLYPDKLCKQIKHCNSLRRYAKHHNRNNNQALSSPYNDAQTSRWQQAASSVSVQYVGHVSECLDHCQQYGDFRAVYNHVDTEIQKTSLLIEYKSRSSLRRLLSSSRQFPNDARLPAYTRQLYYRGRDTRRRPRDGVTDARLRRGGVATEGEAMDNVAVYSAISQQMTVLHRDLSLSDHGTRTRYFVASVIEEFLSGLFPDCGIRLFGSTINGFGRFDCDLDMVLDLDNATSNVSARGPRPSELFHLSRTRPDDTRTHAQTVLDLVGSAVRVCLPQAGPVLKIPRARVPIVRFRHGTGVECDLCIDNQSALAMCELLYCLSITDPRVSPLVFTTRHWARANQITWSHPGPWMSNFMLTLLVTFYLQRATVLPPLQELVTATENSKGEFDYKIHHNRTKHVTKNTESSEDLLKGFFKFYAEFDFKNHGISVLKASEIDKEEDIPILLENPLDRTLNCSKNVMEKHLDEFQEKCKSSLNVLESPVEGPRKGLLAIMNHSSEQENKDVTINVKMNQILEDQDDTTLNSSVEDR